MRRNGLEHGGGRALREPARHVIGQTSRIGIAQEHRGAARAESKRPDAAAAGTAPRLRRQGQAAAQARRQRGARQGVRTGRLRMVELPERERGARVAVVGIAAERAIDQAAKERRHAGDERRDARAIGGRAQVREGGEAVCHLRRPSREALEERGAEAVERSTRGS